MFRGHKFKQPAEHKKIKIEPGNNLIQDNDQAKPPVHKII